MGASNLRTFTFHMSGQQASLTYQKHAIALAVTFAKGRWLTRKLSAPYESVLTVVGDRTWLRVRKTGVGGRVTGRAL
jgi:hypothetical protein